jgi:hypothetical protein
MNTRNLNEDRLMPTPAAATNNDAYRAAEKLFTDLQKEFGLSGTALILQALRDLARNEQQARMIALENEIDRLRKEHETTHSLSI